MELTCGACHAVIQIPTGRVAPNVTVRVTCPRCKEKTIVSPQEPDATVSPADARDEVLAETFEPSQPGQRTALVCMDDAKARARIKSTLERMDFAVDAPPTSQHALRRLRASHWHIVVIEEGFGGPSLAPVARYLAPLNMSMRRETFVVLVAERLKTFNRWQAFVSSVDLVLHPADQVQFAAILEQALAEHDRFYRIFNECLIATGRKAHSF